MAGAAGFWMQARGASVQPLCKQPRHVATLRLLHEQDHKALRRGAADRRAARGLPCRAGTEQQRLSQHGSDPSKESSTLPVDVAASGEDAATSSSSSSSSSHWVVVGLCALAACICSIDRAAISVAILPMSVQFHWSDSMKGAVNSSFYVGYTLTNLFGGYLATRYGAKLILGGGVVLWSLFTVATPYAAAAWLPALFVTRAIMGSGEGVTFPSVQNMVKGWVPEQSRATALSMVYSGGQSGTIVALLTAPGIISVFGWEAVFKIYGSLGLLWMLAWQPLVGADPPLQGHKARQDAKNMRLSSLPLKKFFSNKPFLAILMSHASFGVGHFVSLSWLPTYYNQTFGVNVAQSAWLSMVPWVMTVVCSNVSGWGADYLVNKEYLSTTNARKMMQSIGTLGPALCLLYLASGVNNIVEAAVAMTGVVALTGFQSGGYASNHQDITTQYAAVLFGITNAMNSLMGFLSVYATGVILDATHQSWSIVWFLVAAWYIAGAGVYLTWASSEPQFD